MFRFFRSAGWATTKYMMVTIATIVITLLGARAYTAMQGPPLRAWHTFVPNELDAGDLATASWADYMAAEDRIFRSVETEVVAKIEPEDEFPADRYYAKSPLHPAGFTTDWNRSFILMPEGEPRGAVVLLHGLTDSPYSLRHVARLYADKGFVALAIRIPGHGTVPGGLTTVTWEDWLAATKLAAREAVSRAGAGKPFHIVGYSNGGALAVKYVLDALHDDKLAMPDQVVLFSPMIGVTAFARFAGLAALPSYFFPAFVNTSWLGIVPEYNPFKYNSFPVNAARQSYLLTAALRSEIDRAAEAGKLGRMPPILTFQSLVDHTINVRALVDTLYDKLPANGSELVLFDVNRTKNFDLLIRSAAETLLPALLPPRKRDFSLSVISNAGSPDGGVMERLTQAGSIEESSRPLGVKYPRDVFSLSHIAMPFPPDDALYGGQPAPRPTPEFGISLGTVDIHGEIGVLVVTLDNAMRMSYNPFFSYVTEQIERVIPAAGTGAASGG
ncbi:MAG: alpha/beta hydrolase [Rhizobiaceae bacterium]|nr:alpha/beta hydrolase [Rhizobiaceae bacterium]